MPAYLKERSMEYKHILFEVTEGVGLVTMNRPEALNALNLEVVAELDDLFGRIDSDPEVKVAVITGAGRSFIAGADIEEMGRLTGDEGREMVLKGHHLMSRIENNRKPVIAAINGYSLGGGNELAMSCDFRIASEKAKFGQPEVGLGIIPGYGGTQRLPRLVGKGMAKKLILCAETIDAQEALRIGLVDQVVAPEELMDTVMALAKKICTMAPIAIDVAKSAINSGFQCDLKTGLRIETESFYRAFASEDRVEGMHAFVEKRPAKFKNK